MRLTNAALLALPPGRVLSYEFVVSDADAPALPVSFDQGRHVGEGDRDGSWMAIALRAPQWASRDDLAAAWTAVVARHGTLRTVFSRTDGELRLTPVRIDAGEWVEHLLADPLASDGMATRQVVRAVLDEFCRPFSRPSHRMVVVEPDPSASDLRSVVVIGSDHSHVDTWSMQLLARDLVACLEDVRSGRAPGGTLPSARAFAEHTALLAAMAPAPPPVTEQWSAILAVEGGTMPVFPMPLGDLSIPRAEVVEVRDLLDAAELARLELLAADRGVRLISLAMSTLAVATARLAGRPLRAVFPVHSRHESGWHDSVGWFITNAVIECADPDPVACGAAVKQALALGSHPLAPVFAPYGGMPAGPGMFALSWLDARRLPVQLDPALEVQHVSAVIKTDGVMVWFIANENGLHLRARYPDTAEARASLRTWIDEVSQQFAASALAPATLTPSERR